MDRVKSMREQWQRCRPDLDTAPMNITGNLLLAASLLQVRLGPVFRKHNISYGGFDVLATLRRQGPPFELTPTMLYKELLISSGTMTYRLDVLEKKGLIKRQSHPSDRRGLIIRLTPEGQMLADRVMDAHMENEKQLCQSLPPEDAETLSRILMTWIDHLEKT